MSVYRTYNCFSFLFAYSVVYSGKASSKHLIHHHCLATLPYNWMLLYHPTLFSIPAYHHTVRPFTFPSILSGSRVWTRHTKPTLAFDFLHTSQDSSSTFSYRLENAQAQRIGTSLGLCVPIKRMKFRWSTSSRKLSLSRASVGLMTTLISYVIIFLNKGMQSCLVRAIYCRKLPF